VDDIAIKQKAEIIAKTYVPDVVTRKGEADGLVRPRRTEAVINLITVRAAPPPEPGKIIQLVVHYVELQKDYTKGFRFQWTPTLSDDTGLKFNVGARDPGSGLVTSLTGTVSNLLPKLNWAKEHGHARVLQSQSVIVQDGQPGTVRSLTRIPYQIIGPGNQPSTQFEEAGISSEIKPEILGTNSDSIRMTVNFSLKSLLSVTPSGPLVSNNTVQTVIVVRSGESAAVGGLVSNQSGTDYNKLPKDASDNPLLSLYASKSFRRSQSQFVVFITPIIKTSASAGSERIKSKFRLRD
jgi:pilus assembly protein CpaC